MRISERWYFGLCGNLRFVVELWYLEKILVSFRGFFIFFENYIFAWWNIWISIILLLPLKKTQGHPGTIAFNPTFGSFYLIRTGFTLGELVLLVRVFRLFRLKQIFWGVESVFVMPCFLSFHQRWKHMLSSECMENFPKKSF
jgi:hypothetical protein